MLKDDNENIVAPKSREEHIKNLVLTIQSAEGEMAVFRDHIKDVKKSYVENNWLQKEEVKLAVKAYKQLKGDLALDDIQEYADIIEDIVV